MRHIPFRWLALVALGALVPAACRSNDHGHETARNTEATSRAVPALPASPALPPTPAARPAEGMPAMPIVPARSAAPDGAAAVVNSRAERMRAVEEEHRAALDAYYDLFRNAKTDEERQTLAQTAKEPDAAPFQARARALIDEDPTDKTALDALNWLISAGGDGQGAASYVALIEKHHFQREEMLETLNALQYMREPAATALMERLAKESPHRTVRGRALMGLAEQLKNEASMSQEARGLEAGKERDEFIGYVGQSEFDRLLKVDPANLEKRVIDIYETVVRDYADVPAARKGVIGDAAKTGLFELKNLVVGKVAPDIVGEDIAGVPFKLSDYRGKVVMLDFWGHW